jgi:hypothetical protein
VTCCELRSDHAVASAAQAKDTPSPLWWHCYLFLRDTFVFVLWLLLLPFRLTAQAIHFLWDGGGVRWMGGHAALLALLSMCRLVFGLTVRIPVISTYHCTVLAWLWHTNDDGSRVSWRLWLVRVVGLFVCPVTPVMLSSAHVIECVLELCSATATVEKRQALQWSRTHHSHEQKQLKQLPQQ